MTLAEANEIIDAHEKWYGISCSCHINPPCSKCVECPSEELYQEALNVVEAS